MRKPDPYSDIENALMRLMPVGLGEGVQTELESQLDELCGDADLATPDVVKFPRWIAASGIAAALLLGVTIFSLAGKADSNAASKQAAVTDEAPTFVLLNEADRVERVSDEGLFVDSGGSAVRKVRIRVIGESKVLDEESGIVVTLSEPREEMYLVPVSTF